MNILYLSRWLPYPANNGSKLRIYNLLRRLASYGHRINLVTFYATDEDVDTAKTHLQNFCASVECVQYQPLQRTGWRNRLAFLETRPHSIVVSYQTEVEHTVDRLLATATIDVLVASEIDMAGYGLLARQYNVPALLEELELSIMRTRANHEKSIVAFARHSLRWQKYRAYTRHLAKYYAAITVVSDVERTVVQPLIPATPVHVLPNGADLQTYAFHPFVMAERTPQLIFNGALTFYANYEAMQFFLTDVWSLLHNALPHIELLITGRYSGVDLYRLFDGRPTPPDGVVLTGYQPDIQPLIARSLACIVPLVRGQGTRLKILEAFAVGTPVISTTKGAEGLTVQHEKHLLIADSPAQFVAAIQRLQQNPQLGAFLVENARALVQEHYDWDKIAATFDTLLLNVARIT